MEFETAVEKAAEQGSIAATVEKFLNQNRWSNRIDALLKILDEERHRSAASLAFAKQTAIDAIAAEQLNEYFYRKHGAMLTLAVSMNESNNSACPRKRGHGTKF